MANPNYARGAVKERILCRLLEERGALAVRAAGSHGPFDVYGIFPGYVLAYQVKSGYHPYQKFGPEEREEAKQIALEAGCIPWLAWFPHRENTPKEIPASEWPQPKELTCV